MSGAMLGGFETLEAAYQDWLNTCKGAIVAPTDSGDVTFFREHYVNGYRTVDAIQWKPVPPLSSKFNLDRDEGRNDASAPKESHRERIDKNISNASEPVNDSKSDKNTSKMDETQTGEELTSTLVQEEEKSHEQISESMGIVNNEVKTKIISDQIAQATCTTKEARNSSLCDNNIPTASLSKESQQKELCVMSSESNDKQNREPDDIYKTAETSIGDDSAPPYSLDKRKGDNHAMAESNASDVCDMNEGEADLSDLRENSVLHESQIGPQSGKRAHSDTTDDGMESPRKSRRRCHSGARTGERTPLTLTDEGRTAAMIVATTIKASEYMHVNYRREICTINMKSLVIERRHDSLSSASRALDVSESKLVRMINERDVCDGHLYVDACDAHSILDEMRYAALSAMKKGGGEEKADAL
mmetsp:Transcript_41605/g.60901  ORF Transcript_41605/g.60901 Transcript_41605/m.60901 type:complete len:416 (+) Transcript_41605:730-1977(+)